MKVGFSWPGLLFSGIWLLYKRLWRHAAAFFALAALLALAETHFRQGDSIGGVLFILWLEVGLYIFIGLKGNEWYRKKLQSSGFAEVGTVQAESPDAAIGKITDER